MYTVSPITLIAGGDAARASSFAGLPRSTSQSAPGSFQNRQHDIAPRVTPTAGRPIYGTPRSAGSLQSMFVSLVSPASTSRIR